MITKKNLEEARLAEAKAKEQYETALINRDAFAKYVNEINQGVWDPANNQVPTKGPLTAAQAAMINVNLEEDYSYPAVFTYEEVWQMAGAQLEELELSLKDFAASLEMAKKTAKELEAEYIEDQERAAEIAANSPEVVAAKELNEAAQTKAAADADKAAERAENRKQIFTFLIGAGIVAVLVIVIAKALK